MISTPKIVFLKAGQCHFAEAESQIGSSVQRMRFSAKSPHLQEYKRRYNQF